MRDDALRVTRAAPGQGLRLPEGRARSSRRRAGPVAELYIIERGLVGRRPDNTQADPDRTLGPGELFPVGALSAGGTTTKIFHALEDTACYLLPRERLSRAAARLAGVRALLHAGDHRNAAAVAGEPLQPVQPARRRAADADAHAGRARTARAGRVCRDSDAARGRAEDGGRQGAHDRRRRRPGNAGRACSRSSICCGASCCRTGR